MSANGNRIAISSYSGLNVFDYNNTSGWSPVRQTLKSILFLSYGVISGDGSRLAFVNDTNEIRIYSIQSDLNGQTWVYDKPSIAPSDDFWVSD